MKMSKLSCCIVLLAFFCASANAQVTIGEDVDANKNALLELRNPSNATLKKGLLMPRVELDSVNSPAPLEEFVEGMIVYNTAYTLKVSPGFYYVHKATYSVYPSGQDSTVIEWRKLPFMYEGDWFYLPTSAIDMSNPGNGVERTIDLYQIYTKNFIDSKHDLWRSPYASVSPLPATHAPDDLDYYVTDCSTDVYEILGIDTQGVMKYKILQAPDDDTYINIIVMVR